MLIYIFRKKSKKKRAAPKAEPVKPAPIESASSSNTISHADFINGLVNIKKEVNSDDSSDDEEKTAPVPIIIPDALKEHLENDLRLMKRYKVLNDLFPFIIFCISDYSVATLKFVISMFFVLLFFQMTVFPANPNVVQILEDYVKYYGLDQLSLLNQKRAVENEKKTRLKTTFTTQPKMNPLLLLPKSSATTGKNNISSLAKSSGKSLTTIVEEKVRDELAPLFQEMLTLKEVIDGLRIMFDFFLHQILLYRQEKEWLKEAYAPKPHTPYDVVYVLF